jgi:hypothetical protein
MTLKRISSHVAIWSGVFAFWLLATRNHHPNLTIAISATAVLVTTFALAVYLNTFFLLPRLAHSRRWLAYAVSLIVTVVILDLAAVLLIQFIYDRLWGPDPLRYGFWFNVAADGVLIIIHLAAAMGLVWLAGKISIPEEQKRPGQLRINSQR